jgi:hypothetical protein
MLKTVIETGKAALSTSSFQWAGGFTDKSFEEVAAATGADRLVSSEHEASNATAAKMRGRRMGFHLT